jgi:hypothetical protein
MLLLVPSNPTGGLPMSRSIASAALVTILLTWLLPDAVMAGKNAGGALIVHTQDAYVFSAGTVCTTTHSTPASCEEANTRSDKDVGTVIWLLAAFPATSSPGVSGIYFGIDYDDSLSVDRSTKCTPAGSMEVPDSGWPYEGRGNSIAFGTPIVGNRLFPFYAFKIDGGTNSSYFSTAINQTGGYAAFIDDSSPPESDLVTRFGTVKWYQSGVNYCPTQSPGDAGDADDPDPADPQYVDSGEPTREISVWIEPGAFAATRWIDGRLDLDQVAFTDPRLSKGLQDLGVVSMNRSFPQFTSKDVLHRDERGREVRLADLSNFYHLQFPSVVRAASALPRVCLLPKVRYGTLLRKEHFLSPPQVNDPLFWQWPPGCTNDCLADPQWHLYNQGLRSGVQGNCESAVLEYDIGVDSLQYWPDSPATSVTIGIVDSGILDGHEDLSVIPLDYDEEILLHNHPDDDWCTDHGTKMAGLAAAITNNEIGVAGVCPHCNVIDIEVADPDCDCASHNDDLCNSPVDWPTRVYNAVSMYADGGLRVLNLSFGAPGMTQDPEKVLSLWNAFALGVNSVGANGDDANPYPFYTSPADFPFVIGAGGFVQDGRFWQPGAACAGGTRGNQFAVGLDLCAPGDPGMLTTFPMQPYYAVTSGQSSGAAAIVSGALGWLHGVAVELSGGYRITADDAAGILSATALPYSTNPQLETVCLENGWSPADPHPTCPAEAYGRGRLNMRGALEVLSSFCDPSRPYFHFGKAGWGDPGFGMELTRVITEGNETWREYRVTAQVDLPFNRSPHLPWVVSWPAQLENANGDATTTCMRISGWYVLTSLLDDWVPSGCEMTYGSKATLTGWDYARVEGNDLIWVVEPEDLQMAYTAYAVPLDVADAETGTGRNGGQEATLRVLSNPTQPPVRMIVSVPTPLTLAIAVYDASGRQVRLLDAARMTPGQHIINWDGVMSSGHSAPPGVYWIHVTCDRDEITRKLVILE